MTVIPLYSVTYRGARGIHVELFDSHEQALARREEITAGIAAVAGVAGDQVRNFAHVVIASHEMRIGR